MADENIAEFHYEMWRTIRYCTQDLESLTWSYLLASFKMDNFFFTLPEVSPKIDV